MIALEPLKDKDFETVERWNEGKSADFVVQWAGNRYEHPLTADFLRSHHAGHNLTGADTFIYRIMLDGLMIGTVQLLKIDREAGTAIVGRFLLGREQDRSKGYGGHALREITRIGFEEFGLKEIMLSVFDFNKGAIRCYERCGFETYNFEPEFYSSQDGPWGLYRMRITPERWEKASGR